jgi:hypothetical protein
MSEPKVNKMLIRSFMSKEVSVTNSFLENKVNQAFYQKRFGVFMGVHSLERTKSLIGQIDSV